MHVFGVCMGHAELQNQRHSSNCDGKGKCDPPLQFRRPGKNKLIIDKGSSSFGSFLLQYYYFLSKQPSSKNFLDT